VLTDDGEPAEIVSLGIGRLLHRTMRISFVAHVKATSGYSAQLNQILKELEVAIAGATLGGAKYASLVEAAAREVRPRAATSPPCARPSASSSSTSRRTTRPTLLSKGVHR
jgi:hypothetical protein